MSKNAEKGGVAARPEAIALQSPGSGGGHRRALRDALARFATGVTVITARTPDGEPVGLTVNSFASVSLEPALILWSVGLGASSAEVFVPGVAFVVNVLATDQLPLARAFAAHGSAERLTGPGVADNADGVPVLGGCVAEYHCRVTARHAGGDHAIIVAGVDRFRAGTGTPLLFHDGRFSAPGEVLRG